MEVALEDTSIEAVGINFIVHGGEGVYELKLSDARCSAVEGE